MGGVVIFLMVLGTYALFVLGVLWINHRHWRAASADDPVPYWPAPNLCTYCKPAPEGNCICAGKCGHVRCVGDHTSLATLTAQDMRMLQQWLREGHE